MQPLKKQASISKFFSPISSTKRKIPHEDPDDRGEEEDSTSLSKFLLSQDGGKGNGKNNEIVESFMSKRIQNVQCKTNSQNSRETETNLISPKRKISGNGSSSFLQNFKMKSSNTSQEKEISATDMTETRKRFLEKLHIQTKANLIQTEGQTVEDEGNPPPLKKLKTIPSQKDYTPLEKQYLSLRKKYPGVLLVIEVGYKFRFFEEDAQVCSAAMNSFFIDSS